MNNHWCIAGPYCLVWLGGAVWVFHLPYGGLWNALIWPYYIGRYIAKTFVQL